MTPTVAQQILALKQKRRRFDSADWAMELHARKEPDRERIPEEVLTDVSDSDLESSPRRTKLSRKFPRFDSADYFMHHGPNKSPRNATQLVFQRQYGRR